MRLRRQGGARRGDLHRGDHPAPHHAEGRLVPRGPRPGDVPPRGLRLVRIGTSVIGGALSWATPGSSRTGRDLPADAGGRAELRTPPRTGRVLPGWAALRRRSRAPRRRRMPSPRSSRSGGSRRRGVRGALPLPARHDSRRSWALVMVYVLHGHLHVHGMGGAV
ncbi:hypothetical protein QJS66_01880 [Kocuria rhizophila]|nr:hypothetical protein QJS66_01880 [Kocuria rhizophila]